VSTPSISLKDKYVVTGSALGALGASVDGGHLMAAFTKRLGLSYDAWDVYFVYGPSACWEGADPPSPDFWMQMAGVDAPAFDGATFAREALARLRS
jgi:hypothetical protein